MEAQSTFADIERGGRKRVAKRDLFLRMMDGRGMAGDDKALLSRWKPWASGTRD